MSEGCLSQCLEVFRRACQFFEQLVDFWASLLFDLDMPEGVCLRAVGVLTRGLLHGGGRVGVVVTNHQLPSTVTHSVFLQMVAVLCSLPCSRTLPAAWSPPAPLPVPTS